MLPLYWLLLLSKKFFSQKQTHLVLGTTTSMIILYPDLLAHFVLLIIYSRNQWKNSCNKIMTHWSYQMKKWLILTYKSLPVTMIQMLWQWNLNPWWHGQVSGHGDASYKTSVIQGVTQQPRQPKINCEDWIKCWLGRNLRISTHYQSPFSDYYHIISRSSQLE